MKKIFGLLCVALAIQIGSQGQTAGNENANPNTSVAVAKMLFQAKQVIPPSPEAASLGAYGNVPVSLFTGTPTISVPIYQIAGNSLSLPISLTYNASGFKPEEDATWCGSGWSLNAGGVITRAVRGNPDNFSNYFNRPNVLTVPPQSDFFARDAYLKDLEEQIIETQPDVYYYNFAGHSGKFLLKPDKTVFQKEKDLKKITPSISPDAINSFEVVDEQGTKYLFEATETTIMTPTDDEGQGPNISYTFESAWYLTKITSPSEDEVIEFDYYYSNIPSPQNQSRLNNRAISATYGVLAPNFLYTCAIPLDESSFVNQFPPEVLIYRRFVQSIVLKKNNTPVVKIELVAQTGVREDSQDTDSKLLTNIKVLSKSTNDFQLIKQFDFTYSYFVNNNNPFTKRRLKLDKVQEKSNDPNLSSPPGHLFFYNDLVPLPEKFTTALDHWGFFNNSTNTSLVPNVLFQGRHVANMFFPSRYIGQNANREPSLIGSSNTLINKIVYPTGGYSTFEYELNRSMFNSGNIHDVGGVRIKRITDFSFLNTTATAKDYTYFNDDGVTSGVSGTYPIYHSESSFHRYATVYQTANCEDVNGEPDMNCCVSKRQHAETTLYTFTVSANSIFALGTFQGSPIGYSQVTESQVDINSGQTLGKTIFNYLAGGYFEFDESIENGDLIRERVYSNGNKLLLDKASTYEYSQLDIFNGVMVKSEPNQHNKTKVAKLSDGSYYFYGDWQTAPSGTVESRVIKTLRYPETFTTFQQSKRLTKEVTRKYDQLSNSYLTVPRDLLYEEAGHNYPTTIKENTSAGEVLVTNLSYIKDNDYVFQPNVAAVGTMATSIKDMLDKNIVSLPIEKLQYRQNVNGTDKRYVNGQLTEFWKGKPIKLYFLESQPLLTSVTKGKLSSTNEFVSDPHYRLAGTLQYDANANLVEQSKVNDVRQNYLWNYNGQYPVSEIKGAGLNQVWYTSFETAETGRFSYTGDMIADNSSPTGKKCFDISGRTISASTDNSIVYTLSYWRKSASGGLPVSGSTAIRTGATKNGWTYFEHKIENTSAVNITGTGKIDEVRLYPSTAQMVTRTYDPLIGVTSESDVNNINTYYEYDGLNRLSVVRDEDRNIIKRFRYNYGLGSAPTAAPQTIFYNNANQGTFTKAGCPAGRVGEVVIYIVPYGKYAASSQQDANLMATMDIQANGQNYANTHGQCYYLSAARSEPVYKNNCLPTQGAPLVVYYPVVAGKYRSLVDQATADGLATAEINNQAQAYANTYGSCTCEGDNKRWINNTCETGVQVNIGSVAENGQWKCYYYFRFSDGSVSQTLHYYQVDPCPIAD